MQRNYRYVLDAPAGRQFDSQFKPALSPKEMLALGVFCGKYETVNDIEFPKSWFIRARIASENRDCSFNYFGVDASQPLSVWKKKGWIYEDDPQGWFLWYCRYYRGRRIPEEDERQIKRWRAMKRHASQVKKYCKKGDMNCRPRQRQALLHWAYDSRKL